MLEPYYNKDGITIYQGDCIPIMKSLISVEHFDLCVTDPPYGVGLEYDVYEDTNENWITLMTEAIPLMRQLADMVIFPSCQIKKLDWFYQNYKPDWLMCWYKGSTMTAAYIGFNDWEPHIVYGKRRGVWMHDFFQTRGFHSRGTFGHPCPKPLGWAEHLIVKSKSQSILDPFLGSGTTLVVAKKLGIRGVGIELSKNYCDIAIERLES